MSIYYRIEHTTTYDYPSDISYGQNLGCLIPRTEALQKVLSWQLTTDPLIHGHTRHTDYFGNDQTYFAVEQRHQRLAVTSTSLVHVMQRQESLLADMPWELVAKRLAEPSSEEEVLARQFCFASPRVENNAQCGELARACFQPGVGILQASTALMAKIFEEFNYSPAATDVDSSVAEVVKHRQGVCQDFAHVAISGLRGLGLAAGYVSGYLETLPAPGKPKLRGADASHAWFSVFIPGCGWIDFDPTNNVIPKGQHIVVARGRDFGDVTPLKGVYLGNSVPELSVSVDVNRIPKEKALALANTVVTP
ncbi:transglutaminase family protein [Corallincola holothuriorum]|uniref:Transglutaminase family protein n=1 Tax=Corallincola holothuriorum TaxID=2282215 RepID=A0A368N568_9GAMM|nr:transglutaminase family protein [Corallincola holothuriorum]RCU45320.1 transglutaminase family protein [Corallincola holothuriorum]